MPEERDEPERPEGKGPKPSQRVHRVNDFKDFAFSSSGDPNPVPPEQTQPQPGSGPQPPSAEEPEYVVEAFDWGGDDNLPGVELAPVQETEEPAVRPAGEPSAGARPAEAAPGEEGSATTVVPAGPSSGTVSTRPPLAARKAGASDARIAKLVVESRMAPQSAVDACLFAIQTRSEGGPRLSLADVLVQRGLLTDSQMNLVVQQLPKGDRIGGYELLEKLGEGGMGSVHRARQIALDRIVALKMLPDRLASNPEFTNRFLREARAAAKLDHPNVVRAIDAGETEGKYYFAMEFVDGESLEDILQERGILPEEEALSVAIQAARGLECAWRGGLVHRDIKPHNILLSKNGVAKIADLGLAKESQAHDGTQLTQQGYLMGSPVYMSPEQGKGEEVDIRADIYSLGATLYRTLTGELPFSGKDPVSTIMARFTHDPKPVNEVNPEVSDGMATVIATMMARGKGARYPDPVVLLHDLELVAVGKRPQFAGGRDSQRRQAVKAAKSRRASSSSGAVIVTRRRRREMAFVAVGVVVVAAGVVAAVLLGGFGRQPVPTPVIVRQPDAEEDARRKEEEARRRKLEEEGAGLFADVQQDFQAGRFARAVESVDAVGAKYAATSHGPKLDFLRERAVSRMEEEKRRRAEEARKRAEREKRYRDIVSLAREELGVGDHGRAMDLLIQAKAIRETEEVLQLLEEAKRMQHLARAGDAERVGKLAEAVRLYELVLAIKDDPDVRGRAAQLRRRLKLADIVATGDRLAGEGRWAEAKTAYGEALELARDEERGDVEKKMGAAEREIRYAESIGGARDAVERKAWKEAIARARAALAIKPKDPAARALVDQAKDALGPEPEVTNSIGMQFGLVPAGEFTMGTRKGDADERPEHAVCLDAYYIGKFEVTNAQYEQFSPAHREKWKEYSPDDDMPVIAVTWEEATAFCRWLSRKEGIEYRLPTEAEWERAARGTDARLYPWGNKAPDAGGTHRCNYAPTKARDSWKRDGFELVSPAGAFPAGVSPIGCHDMAGNVWEWCSDWYGKTWYSASGRTNPTGPKGGSKRALRGGAMTSGARSLRCTNRFAKPARFFEANIGFRCVRALRKGRTILPLLEE